MHLTILLPFCKHSRDNRTSAMDDNDGQVLDSIFGQSRAFALNDQFVDPKVIEYLKNVRQEALRTNAIKAQRTSKFEASLYDEGEEVERKQGRVAHLSRSTPSISGPSREIQLDVENCLDWFYHAKQTVLDKGSICEGYDERTIALLLHYLKGYLSGLPDQRGIVVHLLNILKEHPDVQADSELEIDENWAAATVKKLRNKQVRKLDDIRRFIRDSDEEIPMGFKQWYQYLQNNEPTHSAFYSTINSHSIWILVQYMNQEWLRDITKHKKPRQAVQFSKWLLYILFHLPINVTADSVSSLREMGKKCHKLILENSSEKTSDEPKTNIPELLRNLPAEMAYLGISAPPEGLNIVELALSVIAVVYRQRDLIGS